MYFLLLSFKLDEDKAGLLLLLLLVPKKSVKKDKNRNIRRSNLPSSAMTGEEFDELFLNFLLELSSSSCCLQSLVQTKK